MTFGEVIAGGLEAPHFNCNISNKTTAPGKKGKDNDEDNTSGKTLTGNSLMTTGGNTTTATMKNHAAHNLDEEDNIISFALPIPSTSSTQSHLEGNMNEYSFHNAQDGTPTPDEQPGQEEQVNNFNPTTIAVRQTRLITKAVEDLTIDPEDN